MNSPKEFLNKIKTAFGIDGKTAFLSTFIIGLITHMIALTSDIPNHDGLDSMYFDQNMITSGRWFLGVACAPSSYFSVPWLIGVLSLVYLSFTAVVLVKLLRTKNTVFIVLESAMLVTFPSLASNFAYVFTMDGYMLGLFLAVLSVFLVEKGKAGFAFGGIALAFSMGIYQSYLPVAILLCLYRVVVICMEEKAVSAKVRSVLRYLYMGAIGVSLYYVLLRLLLLIQGKVLDTYQGINTMAEGGVDIIGSVKAMYYDFFAFTLKGNVVFANPLALVACIILAATFLGALFVALKRRDLLGNVWTYIIGVAVLAVVPIFTNIILVISPDVNYHLLMRYQWVMFPIAALGFIDNVLGMNCENAKTFVITLEWAAVISAFVISFSYMVSDNIAYSNLQKKYEKTYSYCLRLADRIEQTEGYYTGIPIYMIGVVGDVNYPVTDITEDVTGHMIGMNGDYLLYTAGNYELFYKYYMGISFNFLKPEDADYYYSPEYTAMPSFPAEGSVKIVDGVMYVKTENMR